MSTLFLPIAHIKYVHNLCIPDSHISYSWYPFSTLSQANTYFDIYSFRLRVKYLSISNISAPFSLYEVWTLYFGVVVTFDALET